MSKCYCVHCGELQEELRPAYSVQQKLASCTKCGKEPVSLYTLLVNMNLMDLTSALCPKCSKMIHDGHWCFYCGSKLSQL